MSIAKGLKELKREVEDIHPLLDMLFKKLPNVTDVEYKQGSQENGADFVLIKSDDIFGEEYIGVVVKRDTITKSSHDVTTQIDECIHTRRTVKGKKEVVLDEVWVVTPKNISISAQEFYKTKYSSTKIKFMDGIRLEKLIDKYLPDYFDSIPVIINEYVSTLRAQLTSIEQNSKLTFSAVADVDVALCNDLIPIETIQYKQNQTNRKPPSKTCLKKALEKKTAIIVEGGIGTGKSTLLRSTALDFLDQEKLLETEQVPVYLSFKDLVENHDSSIKQLLDLKFNGCSDKYEFIVLLDGIDEVKLNIEDRTHAISELIGEVDAIENVRLVGAIRSLDQGAARAKIEHKYRAFQIAPLSLNQIINVIVKSCKNLNIKDRILEDLKTSSLYKTLPKTPIAAFLLARLLNENKNNIPANLTELYAKYTELSTGRWDVTKGHENEKVYSIRDAVLQQIARYMIDNELTVISVNEAKDFFTRYLTDRNLGMNSDAVFDELLKHCDLLYLDECNQTFGFRHRTFAEFFYAKNITIHNGFKLTEEAFELYWATIVFFMVGLRKDCPEIIGELIELPTIEDRTRLLKIINMGNIMLAAYTSPYECIKKGVRQVFLDSSNYLLDTINGNIDTRLSAFPQMQLIAIFRHFLADAYGYAFFNDAIEEAMYDIDNDKTLDNDIKCTSLFLLNTAKSDQTLSDLFKEFSSTEMIAKTPFSIQLAISQEAQMYGCHNNHIKKVKRHLKKITGERAVQNKVNELYDRPLNRLNLK